MQTTDLAIKYKNLYQTAELMLDNIKSLGFDVSEYEAILKSITANIHNNIKVNYTKGFAKANYELDYSSGIAELNRLINQLDKYDVYFKILNSCKWLNIKINSQDITNEELKKYVSEMAYNLKQLVKSDTIDYDNEKHIVEMVYEIAYKLIKLELTMTGSSNLYEYIKREDINISYFNIIIKRELAELEKEQKDATFLSERIFQICKNGINSNYFDIDLIKGLLIYNGNNSFKTKINENIQALVDKIRVNDETIDRLAKEASSNIGDMKMLRYHVKEDWKKVFTRFVSFLAATSVILGTGFGIPRLTKKIATSDKYLKTTEVYSTINDDTTTDTTVVFRNSTPSDETMVRAWGKYQDEYHRAYSDYDVSYLDFDTAREYYEYGVDNGYDVVPETDVRYNYDFSLSNNTDISHYKNRYVEVFRTTYEYQGIDVDNSLYAIMTIITLMLYIVALAIIEDHQFFTKRNTIIIGKISELLKELKELISDKQKYEQNLDEFVKKVNQLEELINQDETLRKEFNRLYEANKYLLDNPEELSKKINEIDHSEAKKLVRLKNKN